MATKNTGRTLELQLLRPDRSGVLGKRLAEIRASVIDRLWSSFALLAVIGTPASAMRAFNTGWLRLYTFHVAMGALVLAIYFARRRLPAALKLGLLIAIFWVVGLVGLLSTGLIGASLWWLSLSVLLLSALYSIRAGMVAAALMVLVTALTGVGYVQGWLVLPFDANTYIRTPTAWGTIVIAVVLLPIMVFVTVASLHNSTLLLLEEVDAQHELVRELATHDELTGVPKLRLGIDRLEQAILGAARSGGKVAVLFIDLDGFKAINDTHGHGAGDAVLKAVARRCRDAVRADDTIARAGGDEFLAVIKEVESDAAALALAQRFVDALAAPVAYGEQALRVGASIGVAVFPQHAGSAADLIRAGDAAMYEAKRSGTNQVRLAQAPAAQASA
jgi:diguanylate cyclase (GGDEF)-like protein